MKTDSTTKGHLLSRSLKEQNIAVTVRAPSGFASPLHAEVIKDEQIKFTRAKAKELLALDTFQGERIVNTRHVQVLFNAWSSGRFMWEHVCLGLAHCEGKLYRLNGQHTAWLRTNIKDNHDEPVVRCITYKVKNQEDLRALYSTFDRNKSRSFQHVVKCNLVGMPVTKDIWPSVIGHLASGMKLWLYTSEASRNVTPEDLVALIEEKHPELFKKVAQFYQSKYDVYHPLRRRALCAALFATFDVAPHKAAEFWSAVTDAIGYKSKQDPRWHLRRYCDDHTSSKSDSKSFVADERWYCTAIQCWNKWRAGEKVDHLKPTDKRSKAI